MEQVWGTILVIVIILFSTILHEIMHGFVAYKLGDNTAKYEGRLTLNPLSHIDPYMSIIVPVVLYLMGGPIIGGAKPVPVNSRNLKWREWGFALVGLAGPMTNILLAFIAFVIAVLTGVFTIQDGVAYHAVNDIASTIFYYFVSINLGLAMFNLLPIPPLDGSRLVYAIAPDGVRRVMESLERYGVIVALGVILVFSSQIATLVSYGVVWLIQAFTVIVDLFL